MNTLHKQLFGVAAVAVLGAVMAHAQVMTPISVSGFNNNGVYGTTGGPVTATMAGNWTYFATIAPGAPGGTGLPMGTTFTSAFNANTTFTLQPASAAQNVFSVTSDGGSGNSSVTVTLSGTQAYSELAFLGASSQHFYDITINYADSTHSSIYYANGNWGSGGNIGISEGTYLADTSNGSFPGGFGSGINLFETDITPSSITTPIASITLTGDPYGGGNTSMIFALSGAVVEVPEPSSLALVGLGALTLLGCGRRSVAVRSA